MRKHSLIKRTLAGLMAAAMVMNTAVSPVYAATPDASSTQESQDAQRIEDALNPGSAPKKATRSQMQERQLKAPRLGATQLIQSFSTQFVYGADNTADGLVWTPKSNAAGHRFVFRMNYALSGQGEYPENTLQFVIPKHILKDRYGSWGDSYELSLPTEQEVADGEADQEVYYTYREEGDNLIIYNYKPISAAENGYIEVAYATEKLTSYYKDMASSNNFTATMRIKGEERTGDAMAVKINTTANLVSSTLRYPAKYSEWQPWFGTAPADHEDYLYLVFDIETLVDRDGSQPYNLSYTDTVSSAFGDTEVVGYKFSGMSRYQTNGTINNQSMTGYRYDSVLVRYKKSDFGELDRYTITDYLHTELTPADGVDPHTTADSQRTFNYAKARFRAPAELYNTRKAADGAWRDYYERGYGGYTDLSYLGNRAAEYSSYALMDLKMGTISYIGNLDYALWSDGRQYSHTLEDGADPLNPANYGKVNVKHVQVDDYVHFSEDDRALTSADFQIDTLAYEVKLRGASFDEEKQEFVSAPVELKDTDEAYVYAKFGDDTAWHLVATENLKTRNVSVDNTYVTGVVPISTGHKLSFVDNCVAYKIESSSPYYMSTINSVPNMRIKNSQYVRNYIAAKSEIEVVNEAYGNFIDQHDEIVFAKHVHESDFIRVIERNSDLTKSITTATNVPKKRQYTIGWKVAQNEDYLMGDNERHNITQQGGKFYDLIPMGAQVDQATIAVETPDGYLEDNAYSYKVYPNFKDSGRTMLVVDITQPADKYTLYYDTIHPWDSIKDYGHEVHNPVGYETGNDDIANGYADNGGELTEKALFTDLDPDSNAPKWIYTQRDYDIAAVTAAAAGFTKKVHNADETSWFYETETTAKGEYQYRVRYMNSYTTTAKDIIVYDSLENYTVPGGAVSDFHGTLKAIDTKQLTAAGVKPVVYVSEIPNLDIETHRDITDSSVWHVYTSGSMANVKAIAIDLRRKPDGTPFILEEGASLTAMLFMQAPAGADAAGAYPYAYNNVYTNNTIINFDGTETPFFIHHDYTAVKFTVTADMKLHKTSKENASENVPNIKYRLYGTSDYGTDVDFIKATAADGTIDFGKIEKGHYVLSEYETNDDWLMDYTQHAVEVTALGKLLIDGTDWTDLTYETADQPRVHGDLSLVKRRENETDGINNTWFRLSGVSDYGTDVSMTGKTDNAGRVKFKNIEKGTYTLVEAQANDNYILNTTKWVVKVDDGGAASVSAPDTAADRDRLYEVGQLGNAYVVFNEPRFWDATIRKIDATTIDNESSQQIWLQGATFTLDGVSDLGTEYHATVTSDENGRVLFTNLEKGSYVLKETVAPTGVDETGKTGTGGNRNYLKDNKEYILHVDNQGNVTVDGLSKNDLGDVKFPNDRALDGRITVTKKWVDVDPANRKIPQLTLSTMEPVHGQNVLRFNANGGKFTNGTGINDTVYSDPVSKIAAVEDESKKRVSHTDNISDDGTQNGNYKNNITTNEVITIDGADSLKITITYGGESANYDYVCAWEGSHPGYKANTNSTSSFTGKLGGGSHTAAANTKTFKVEGDTVTFSFRSDSGGVGDGYGYYAVIIPFMKTEVQDSRLVSGTYEEPKRRGFLFTGWYAEPECENLVSSDGTGIVMDGDKTLYAGWREAIAYFDAYHFNTKIKKLAGDSSKPTTSTVDTNILFIKPYTDEIDTSVFTEDNIVSENNSDVPVYAWFDSETGTVYWYSDTINVKCSAVNPYFCAELKKLKEIDVTGIDFSGITSTSYWFRNCEELETITADLSNIHLKDMDSMFKGCKKLKDVSALGLDTWDTSKVTRFTDVFNGCTSLESVDVSGFNTENATSMQGMFAKCSSLITLDVSNFDTSKVTDFGQNIGSTGEAMFEGCSSLTSLNIENFDTSNGKDLAQLFAGCRSLSHIDTSNIDTRNATDLSGMFAGCRGLTSLDVTGFDTSNATNMSSMFSGCIGLTSLDVTGFDTGNVTKMSGMFNGCSGLTNLDVSEFDTSNVTSMYQMFYNCGGLTSLDVSGFNTSSVTNMSYMFSGCSGLTSLDVSGLDTSKVTDMNNMFYNCKALINLDLSGFDTSNVANMERMFSGCSGLTSLDVSGLDTSKVTDMSEMFSRCSGLTSLDVSDFDTSNVTDMFGMFSSCNFSSIDISNFNTGKVTNFGAMFSNCDNIVQLELTNFDTTQAKNMDTMFSEMNSIQFIDLSSFNTTNVTNMCRMFDNCTELTTVYASDTWDMTNVTNTTYMFGDTKKLQGNYGPYNKLTYKAAPNTGARVEDGIEEKMASVQVAEVSSEDSLLVKVVDFFFPPMTVYAAETGTWGTATYELDDDNNLTFTGSGEITKDWPTGLKAKIVSIKCADGVTVALPENSSSMFASCSKLSSFYSTGFDTSKVTTMYQMFRGCSGLTSLDVSGFDTSKVADMGCMFQSCNALTSLDVSGFDTSNVTSMGGMFQNCSALTSLNVSSFDTSKVTTMYQMFSGCSGLTSLDVSRFDTSKVTNMSSMFQNCSGLTSLDVSSFDTSNVTTMSDMFRGCSGFTTLDVSGFDTSNVTNMSSMFQNCSGLTSLDLSGFDTSNVTTMSYMFNGCSNLTSLDVSNFDTSKVTSMYNMFNNCNNLTSLDVSRFDTSNVTSMTSMFSGCKALTSLDVSNFDTSNVTSMSYMFSGCAAVANLDVSSFDTSNVTNMSYMFYNCSVLISLDVSGFDTSEVTDMWSMFYGCNALTSLDVSGFNTSKVTKTSSMFYGCKALTSLDVSRFDTSNVKKMDQMFRDCKNLTRLDVSKFNTSNVTNMFGMFSGCSGIIDLDVSSFDTSKVTDMSAMFSGCSSLANLDVSGFDTSKVTSMSYMFYNCGALTSLDLSGFDTSNVTNMDSIFRDCSDLQKISFPDKFFVGVYAELLTTIPWCHIKDINGAKTHDETEYTTKQIMTFSDTTTPQLGGVWKRTDYLPHKDLGDGNYEYYSDDDEWEQDGDTWTYTFKVFDDQLKYYLTEKPIAGYTSPVMTGFEIVDGKNGVKTAVITNTADDVKTGSIKLSKEVVGLTTDEKFIFDITFAGMTGTKIYDGVIFTNGKGRVTLGDGEEKVITGIPENTVYTVTEVPDERFSVTSTNETGTIAADTETEVAFTNTYIPTIVEPEPPVDITVRKEIAGRFETAGEYHFTAWFEGLEKRKQYTYTGSTFTAADDGTAVVEFTLAKDAEVTFSDIPDGAKYQFTEDAGDYVSAFHVTDTAGLGSVVMTDKENTSRNEELSTEIETANTGEQVKVTFTNTLNKMLPLHIRKVVYGSAADKAAYYPITIVIRNLQPGERVDTSIGRLVADGDGVIEKDTSIKEGEPIEIYALPVGATYEITEQKNHLISSYTVEDANNNGHIVRAADANNVKEKAITTAVETVNENEDVTVTLISTKKTDLTIRKLTSNETTDRFTFTITLTGTLPATLNVINNGTAGTATLTDNRLTVTLGKGEYYTILALPTDTIYGIVETDNPKYRATIDNAGTPVQGATAAGNMAEDREVIYTNTVADAKIKVQKQFNKTYSQYGDAVSVFRISGTAHDGTHREWVQTIKYPATEFEITVPVGTYTVEEVNTSRYYPVSVAGVAGDVTVNTAKMTGTVNLTDGNATVKFTNDFTQWEELSHTNEVVNIVPKKASSGN